MNGTLPRGRAARQRYCRFILNRRNRGARNPATSRLGHTHTHTQPYIRTYMHVHTTYIYPAVNSKYVREVHSDELSRRTQFRRRFLFVRATKPTWLGKRREFRPYTKYFHIPFATAAPFSSSLSLLSPTFILSPSVALCLASLALRPIPKGIGIYKEERKLRPPPPSPSAGGGKAI